MQAVKGYFSNGWFTPSDNVVLPNQIEAVLVFDETITEPLITEAVSYDFREAEKQSNINWLNQIKKSLELSRDEDLSDFPKQGQMKLSYDDWLA